MCSASLSHLPADPDRETEGREGTPPFLTNGLAPSILQRREHRWACLDQGLMGFGAFQIQHRLDTPICPALSLSNWGLSHWVPPMLKPSYFLGNGLPTSSACSHRDLFSSLKRHSCKLLKELEDELFICWPLSFGTCCCQQGHWGPRKGGRTWLSLWVERSHVLADDT